MSNKNSFSISGNIKKIREENELWGQAYTFDIFLPQSAYSFCHLRFAPKKGQLLYL